MDSFKSLNGIMLSNILLIATNDKDVFKDKDLHIRAGISPNHSSTIISINDASITVRVGGGWVWKRNGLLAGVFYLKMSVIIVGASKGIGLYLWNSLKDEYDIIPIARTSKIKGIIESSISDEDCYKNVDFGNRSIKMVIFCASTLDPIGDLMSVPMENIKKSIQMHLFGPLAFLKGLQKLNIIVEGAIFLTSMLGENPIKEFGSYSLGKGIVNMLPKLIKLPFCCAIDPGLIKSEMSTKFILCSKNDDKELILKELEKSDERLYKLTLSIKVILLGKKEDYNERIVKADDILG